MTSEARDEAEDPHTGNWTGDSVYQWNYGPEIEELRWLYVQGAELQWVATSCASAFADILFAPVILWTIRARSPSLYSVISQACAPSRSRLDERHLS